MDKKNMVLGLACIIAGIGVMFWQASRMPDPGAPVPPQPAGERAVEEGGGGAVVPSEGPRERPADESDAMLDLLARDVADADAVAEVAEAPARAEERVTLSNEHIEVTFTTRGGAVRTVRFLKTKRGEPDDYVYNRNGLLPALGMSLAEPGGEMVEFARDYVVERSDAHSVSFVFEAPNGLRIRRSYTLANGGDQDPYVIRHRTTFANASETAKTLATIYLNLGTARPLSVNQLPTYLNVGVYDGDDADFTAVNKLTGGGGFLGLGASAPKDVIVEAGRFEWVSVKNQFFAGVLSSETVAREIRIQPVYPEDVTKESANGSPGITGSAGYELGTVPAGEETALDFDFYIGPKEFKRLQALGNEQDLVMQFGFFGFFSKLLLAVMYAIHSVVPSWGWSIIIMTILIKLLFWPLTAKASQSQKRMAKIQGPMAELKEKYKDNPQKMQQETLKLFREHQVNPVAGCLPLFIQMPIFLGLFYMLRTASELRHEPFLWVADLSQPDTITEVGGFPINLLPLIMGVTMYFQMRMVPVSPTADPVQQKIFKFLPFVFLVFLYNFASGLVVYWTTQNLLTILQQKITNSRPEPTEPTQVVRAKEAHAKASGAKPVGGRASPAKGKGRRKK